VVSNANRNTQVWIQTPESSKSILGRSLPGRTAVPVRPAHPKTIPVILCVALLLASMTGDLAGKAKIKSTYDKAFDFRTVHTWAWHVGGAGTVQMMRSSDDDPAAVKQRFEPTIMSAVEAELTRRGLAKAGSPPADLDVTYYLLVSVGSESQQLGQFVNPNVALRLPPFSGATTSFNVVEQGSLVIDISSPTKQSVVWRGIAQAELKRDATDDQRKARLRDAIKDILQKYPPGK
jgi:Domain of unknown function (DUF4136)